MAPRWQLSSDFLMLRFTASRAYVAAAIGRSETGRRASGVIESRTTRYNLWLRTDRMEYDHGRLS